MDLLADNQQHLMSQLFLERVKCRKSIPFKSTVGLMCTKSVMLGCFYNSMYVQVKQSFLSPALYMCMRCVSRWQSNYWDNYVRCRFIEDQLLVVEDFFLKTIDERQRELRTTVANIWAPEVPLAMRTSSRNWPSNSNQASCLWPIYSVVVL